MNTFVTISQSCPHCYLKKIFSRVQFWSTIPRRRVFAVKWMSCGWDLGGYCSAFPWSSFSENGFLFFFFAWFKIIVNGMPRLQRFCPHSLFMFNGRGFGWRCGSVYKVFAIQMWGPAINPQHPQKSIHIDTFILLSRWNREIPGVSVQIV